MNRTVIGVLFLVLATACPATELAAPQEGGDAATIQRLEQEKEVLRRKLQEKEDDARLREEYIENVTTSLNGVQDDLTKLTRQRDELSMRYSELVGKKDQTSVTQSEQLLAQIQTLRDRFEVSSIELENARKAAEAGKVRIAQLVSLIEKLQAEVRTRSEEAAVLRDTVTALRAELELRDEKIRQQDAAYGELVHVLGVVEDENVKHAQQADRVYYRVASYEVLQHDHVIQTSGLGWSLAKSDFNKDALKPISQYALREIKIDVPKWRLHLITLHDKKSYQLVQLRDNTSVLRIRKRAAFWATGPYLVIAVDVN